MFKIQFSNFTFWKILHWRTWKFELENLIHGLITQNRVMQSQVYRSSTLWSSVVIRQTTQTLEGLWKEPVFGMNLWRYSIFIPTLIPCQANKMCPIFYIWFAGKNYPRKLNEFYYFHSKEYSSTQVASWINSLFTLTEQGIKVLFYDITSDIVYHVGFRLF